ncbi:MFS transporter [bacterium]|nr:MFS transporter [bacterium]
MENFNEKKTQLWLNTAHFTNDIYTGMLNPIMPFIAVKLGITMAIATIVLSLSHICASLLQPIFGFFADNLHRRIFIFWGILFTSVFISFAPSANKLWLLTLFVILGSLGSSFFHPQALGLSNKFTKTDIAKNMGIFMGLGTLGFSLGPVFSAGVAQYFGLDKIPYLAVLGVVVGLSMFFFIPKLKPDIDNLRTHEDFLHTFKSILTNRKLNLLNLIAVLKSLVTTSSCILLPFLWKNLGHSAFYIGFALFAFNCAAGIGAFLSSRFEKKVGTKNVFYFSMMLTFPMMVLFMLTYKTYPSAALVIFILTGLIQWMAVPVTMVMAQSVLPEYKSIIGGFINGFSWGVVAIIMTGIGFIAQAKGIMPVLIVVSAIPAFLSYPIVRKLFQLI